MPSKYKQSPIRSDHPLDAQPPEAIRHLHVQVIHGDVRDDDYFWLRNRANPDVAAYLDAENQYVDGAMASTLALQETLYEEMLHHMQQTDEDVPYRYGDYLYYSRTEAGKQYPIYCRRKHLAEASEEITLDMNCLMDGSEFLSLGAYEVSDDDNLLAFSLDSTGSREFTLYVKDLRTGEMLSDRAEKVGTVAWAADNATLFYTIEDQAKRQNRVYRHKLGGSAPSLLYKEEAPMFCVDVHRSRSRAFLFIVSYSHTTSDVRYLRADQPDGDCRLIAEREDKHSYFADHHGDKFYIHTNSGGMNYRLVTAPTNDPSRAAWAEIIPHRSDVLLEEVFLFANHCVLLERKSGLPRIGVADLLTDELHYVEFPEPAFSVFPVDNRAWDTVEFRFTYQSPVTPASVYDYDMDRRVMTLRKKTDVPGGFDGESYTVERLYATAPDSVLVPISLVYHNSTRRDGTAPLHLYAYGAYGFPLNPTFSSNRLSLLDRGVIVALAHVRGGGEMGKLWHDAGRMLQKTTTFTDCIAAVEHLVAAGYVARDRVVMEGASVGGLVAGAVSNMRSDLFRAVLLRVPFVDVINTMLDAELPLVIGEYEEWGNPGVEAEYACMKTYCPYTNLESKSYPAMLVKTSFHDSQVMYWQPAKYVARLRTLKIDDNLLLLKTDMTAGHGGSSGRYDHRRETAFEYAFLLTQLGITQQALVL